MSNSLKSIAENGVEMALEDASAAGITTSSGGENVGTVSSMGDDNPNRTTNPREARMSRRVPNKGPRLTRNSGTPGGLRSKLLDLSTKNLESQLSTIDKILKRHEQELRHPVWMETVRGEFDGLARLRRRVDLTEADVNNIRDVIYTSGTLKAIEESAAQVELGEEDEDSATDARTMKMEYEPDGVTVIKKNHNEIEKLRSIARRLELHKATESVLVPHIEKLTRQGGDHEIRLKELESSDDMDKLRLEVHEKMDEMTEFCEDMEQDLAEQATEVDFRIETVESRIATYDKMLTGGGDGEDGGGMVIPNLKDIEARFVSKKVFEEKVGAVLKDQVSSSLDQLAVLQRANCRRAVVDASKRLSNIVYKLGTGRCKKAWQRWNALVAHHHSIKSQTLKRVGGRMRLIVKRFMAGPAVALFFGHWKKFCQWGDLMHTNRFRLLKILDYWKSRLPEFIDRRAWLYRWRRNTHLASVATYADEIAEKHADLVPRLDEHTATAAHSMESMDGDHHGRLVMLGFMMQAMSHRVESATVKSAASSSAVAQLQELVEKVQRGAASNVDERIQQIENRQKNQNNFTVSRLDNLEMLREQRERARAEEQTQLDGRLTSHEERLGALEKTTSDNARKLKSALALQGELMDRLSRVEMLQKNMSKDVAVARQVADDALTTGRKSLTQGGDQHYKSNQALTAIEVQIDEMKAFASESSARLSAMDEVNEKNQSRTDTIGDLLGGRLAALQEFVRAHVDEIPTAKELVVLCHQYEHKVEATLAEGAMSNVFPPQLAVALARFAHRLAIHITRTADIAVLNVLVVGPQRAPPRSAEVAPKSGKDVPRSGDLEPVDPSKMEVNAHMGTGAPEDDAFAIREELLQSFHREWMEVLAASDTGHKALSSVRTEARAIFHRRFLSTLDLAMSKHDSTVMTAPSTFGNRPANPPGGTCVACDRPLRMRYRARPITYLSNQQSLLEGAALQRGGKASRPESTTHGGTMAGPVASASPDRPRARPTSAALDKTGLRSSTESSNNNNTFGNAATYGRPASQTQQRPASAGALRHRNAVKTAAIGDGTYVMRAGFKMPVLREQELLAAKLAQNFPMEASMAHTRQIYPGQHEQVPDMSDSPAASPHPRLRKGPGQGSDTLDRFSTTDFNVGTTDKTPAPPPPTHIVPKVLAEEAVLARGEPPGVLAVNAPRLHLSQSAPTLNMNNINAAM